MSRTVLGSCLESAEKTHTPLAVFIAVLIAVFFFQFSGSSEQISKRSEALYS